MGSSWQPIGTAPKDGTAILDVSIKSYDRRKDEGRRLARRHGAEGMECERGVAHALDAPADSSRSRNGG
jgi:hypothetical protein